ncbi:YHYH domain-containing protein [Pseudomonas mosselii]
MRRFAITTNKHRVCLMKIFSLLIAAVLSFSSVTAYAHSGGTDSKGCHTNHKTGERHCH